MSVEIAEKVEESQIVEAVEGLLKAIKDRGKKVKDTYEVNNVWITLDRPNYEMEKGEVKKYFNSRVKKGKNDSTFEAKMHQEKAHYEYLKWGLIQKVEYNKFNFGEQPLNSRKICVHSEDCISLIQVMFRLENKTFVNAYMRSTEITQLLPIDLLGIVDIVDGLIEEIKLLSFRKDLQINIIIGSAHIYLENDIRRLKYEDL